MRHDDLQKKKIRIITIHYGTNHGSVLQSYALSTYLKAKGHDVKVIDYIPPRYKIWNSLLRRNRGKYPLPVIMLYYPLAVLKSFRVREKFERFLRRNIELTKRYTTKEALKKDPPEADVYISGSDQVWNNDYNGNEDLTYFLDFAPAHAKRIAYAASFGKERITEQEYLNSVQPLLTEFAAISVREKDAQNILQEMNISSVHVVDPVFLLTKEQWRAFERPIHVEEKYTLVYVMDGLHEELLDYAQKIQESMGNAIYTISFSKINDPRVSKSFYLTDPKDFVGLMQKADTVVTNSFHGTAFSVMMGKKFITVGKKQYNSRMESLLKRLNLMQHFVPSGENLSPERICAALQRKNDNSAETLQAWVEISKEFIDNSIEK